MYVSWILDVRHTGHFGDGEGGEAEVDFHGSQEEVTSASLERVLFQAVGEMSGVKIFPFGVCPGAKVHGALAGGYVLPGNEGGHHSDFLFVMVQKVSDPDAAAVAGLQEVKGGAGYRESQQLDFVECVFKKRAFQPGELIFSGRLPEQHESAVSGFEVHH